MIVAGIGFRKGAGVASLRDALLRAGGDTATALATAADKADALAIRQLSIERRLPLHAVAADDLRCQTVLSHSDRVHQLYGTGSLAEAAALAAAGPGARLLGPRITSNDGMATAALAIGT